MKTLFFAASLALTMITLSPAKAAGNQDAHDDHHEQGTTAAAIHSGRGKVNSVNVEAGTVNLSHDPITSLKWPRMTMDFKAHDPALLKDLKPGELVDFELTKIDGNYQIVKVSPADN